MVNHDVSPEEHEQRESRLERLQNLQKLQEVLVEKLKPKDPYVHAKRIYDKRTDEWYIENGKVLSETENTVVVEVPDDEDDAVLRHITNTGANVQIQLTKGKKRKITVRKTFVENVQNEPGTLKKANIASQNAKQTPEKPKVVSRINAFHNAKNKINVYKQLVKNKHVPKTNEQKKKISKAKNEICDYEMAVRDYVDEKNYELKRITFLIDAQWAIY